MSTPAPLTSVQALCEHLGREFDPEDVQAYRAVDEASALVRAHAHQTISLVSDDEVELRGTADGNLYLPERPVVEVSSVAVRGVGGTEFLSLASTGYVLAGGTLIHGSSYWGGAGGAVQVTYTHGFDVIPADIETVTIAVATRILTNPLQARQEVLGSYQITYPAEITPSLLSDFDLKVLDDYARAAEV